MLIAKIYCVVLIFLSFISCNPNKSSEKIIGIDTSNSLIKKIKEKDTTIEHTFNNNGRNSIKDSLLGEWSLYKVVLPWENTDQFSKDSLKIIFTNSNMRIITKTSSLNLDNYTITNSSENRELGKYIIKESTPDFRSFNLEHGLLVFFGNADDSKTFYFRKSTVRKL